MKKIFGLIIIILLLGLIGTQLILPGVISNRIANNVQQDLEASDEINVTLNSFPAFKMLLGQIDSLKLSGRRIVINKLLIDRVKADFNNLKLQRIDGKYQIIEGENDYLNLRLTEKDLNDYLATRSELDIFQNFKLELLPKKIMLTGSIKIFNAIVNLQISGDFEVVDNVTILFRSDKLAIENIVIPTALVEQLKDQLRFEISFVDFPLPLNLSKVNLEEDYLEIRGSNE